MITYNDIATREDKIFLSNARRSLGKHKFESLIPKVKVVFREAYNDEPNENKKENIARRAANMIYTTAINEKV
jgi:hypothetical protein